MALLLKCSIRCNFGRDANPYNASCKLDYLPTRLWTLRIILQHLGGFSPQTILFSLSVKFSNGFVTSVELHANLSRSNRAYPSYSLIPQMRFAYLDTEERVLSVTKLHLVEHYLIWCLILDSNQYVQDRSWTLPSTAARLLYSANEAFKFGTLDRLRTCKTMLLRHVRIPVPSRGHKSYFKFLQNLFDDSHGNLVRMIFSIIASINNLWSPWTLPKLIFIPDPSTKAMMQIILAVLFCKESQPVLVFIRHL